MFSERNLDATGGIPSIRVELFDSPFKVFSHRRELKKMDIFHLATRNPKLRKVALTLARRYKKPIVVSALWYIEKGEQKREVEFLNGVSAVVVPTQKYGEELAKMGVRAPIAVVPEFLGDRDLRAKFVARKMMNGETLRIFWKGEMGERSGILPLLEALSGLDTEQGYELYAYGTGEMFREATKFADKHRVKAKFFGDYTKAELQKRMRECQLGVVSRVDDEVEPKELLEMKAAGLPILIRDEKYKEFLAVGGYVLVKKRAVVALMEAIMQVMKAPWAIEGVSKRNLADRNGVMYAGQRETMVNIYRWVMGK